MGINPQHSTQRTNTLAKWVINQLVRGYLRRCPITEGKSLLLNLTKNWIIPEDPIVIFETKYPFQLKVNLVNPEHQYLYLYSTHDERYVAIKLPKIIKQGDICWDIGANIGFYTCLLASQVDNTGAVVAFEPAARTCGYLYENVSRNPLPFPESHRGSGQSKRSRCPMVAAAALYVKLIVTHFHVLIQCEPSQHWIRWVIKPFTGVFTKWHQLVDSRFIICR